MADFATGFFNSVPFKSSTNYPTKLRSWYTGAVNAAGTSSNSPLTLGNVFTSFTTGDVGLSLSAVFRNSTGDIMGVVCNEIFLSELSDLLRDQVSASGSSVYLTETPQSPPTTVDNDYLLLASSNEVAMLDDAGARVRADSATDFFTSKTAATQITNGMTGEGSFEVPNENLMGYTAYYESGIPNHRWRVNSAVLTYPETTNTNSSTDDGDDEHEHLIGIVSAGLAFVVVGVLVNIFVLYKVTSKIEQPSLRAGIPNSSL